MRWQSWSGTELDVALVGWVLDHVLVIASFAIAISPESAHQTSDATRFEQAFFITALRHAFSDESLLLCSSWFFTSDLP